MQDDQIQFEQNEKDQEALLERKKEFEYTDEVEEKEIKVSETYKQRGRELEEEDRET